ncbi:ligase-associated DNA damage response endonuclease PdeM [Martelella endophytica]|uniref:Metallophosphatase n=1 Tax=Martelella endophytica TaxID=1486262 RepID=A0A0D5LMH3_MAREN|nr:ligase-associated DNA damage response endonuclease PdeM [Martelella endophytica]AJY44513.1 metallophosphatase [Martelella endophytica]
MSLQQQPRERETACDTRFCGHAVTFDASGALWFPELSLLVVSDLHLERGAAHARRGFFLPPYDTGRTLAALAAVIDRYRPERVVSLGDNFHDRVGARDMAAAERQSLEALTERRDWVWINGNHDPDGVAGLPGRVEDEWLFEGLTFRHEPKRGVKGEICGHLHPSATLRRPGKSVRRPCFALDGARLMLPAFSTTAGGLDLRHAAFAGLFDRRVLTVHMLGPERVYSLPFAALSA